MRVYLAGPYSSDNVMGVLKNIKAGQDMAVRLLCDEFNVYCPWCDHTLVLAEHGDCLFESELKKNSMAWLEVSDAVFCIDGWQKSKGALAEIERAKQLNIPVFFKYKDLLEYQERGQ